MAKINVLSFEIANLIAAGEVVERPSSVMKELIENSIDSGAKNIVAEIKRGGVALIRVSDDGCGIAREDMPVALKRHATSKIKDREDLENIMTLGFRGEALAAISSVSKLTLISKTRDSESATMLTSEAGVVTDTQEVYSADGTTVVVSDLFYNVPARRKFLKKDSTEALNVAALVEKVALSRPDISIQLLIDGEERFKTSGDGNLLNTIYSVLGKDFSQKLIPVESEANGIKISGYVGRSDNVRRNRNLMNVFINARFVKSLTAGAAIEKAFTSYIAPECFPCCVLMLEMNPAHVDVNVHPAKLEVKFFDERAVFEAVYYSVKNAIEKYEYRPEMELKSKTEKNYLGAFAPVGEKSDAEQIGIKLPPYLRDDSTKADKSARAEYEAKPQSRSSYELDKPLRIASHSAPSYGETKDSSTLTPKESIEVLKSYKVAQKAPYETHTTFEATESESKLEDDAPSFKIVGEAFDTYVIIEKDGELLIIDKHAAHERVIFEELKSKNEADGRVATQMLILPICIELSGDEISVAQLHKDELCEIGFEYTLSGKICELTSIPDAISSFDAEGLFVTILDDVSKGVGTAKENESIRREKALYQIACKAAIKGGRRYDKPLIEWLVAKLLSLPDITVCPHGRPVAYKLTKRELDRQFDRIK